jgi:hypothetical protein
MSTPFEAKNIRCAGRRMARVDPGISEDSRRAQEAAIQSTGFAAFWVEIWRSATGVHSLPGAPDLYPSYRQSLDFARRGADRLRPTKIGNGVYIGPNAIIQMGMSIGDRAVIGANSLVNRDVPPDARAFGSPARIGERPARSMTS